MNLQSIETGDYVLVRCRGELVWIRVTGIERNRMISGELDSAPVPKGFAHGQPIEAPWSTALRLVKACNVNSERMEGFFAVPAPRDGNFDRAWDVFAAADPNGILARCRQDVVDARIALAAAELRLSRIER